MIDTHSHIYHHRFEDDFEDMLQRARDVKVDRIYLPNIDVESIDALKNLANTYSECVPMMGLHPSHVKEDFKEQLSQILQELESGDLHYAAVGEIGIDLYWDQSFLVQQKEAFSIQIEQAKKMDLPIVIHCRNAFDEVFEVLDSHYDAKLKGIFHCFTGTIEQGQRAIDLNLHLGIGGIVTFKNGGLDKVVKETDLKHLVLETDAPYLAPMPYRGKRNEPSYLKHIAEKIAEIKGISLDEVDRITTENAKSIFD